MNRLSSKLPVPLFAALAVLASACSSSAESEQSESTSADDPASSTDVETSTDADVETSSEGDIEASFDIGEGQTVFLDCKGTGSPTVIVEPGFGDSGSSWIPIQTEIAADTRFCWWSRTGVAAPAPGETRTIQDAVDNLAAVLEVAEVEPPYLMVGHSFGGHLVRLFTDQHRDGVAGMLLVDSSHPDQGDLIDEAISEALGREIESPDDPPGVLDIETSNDQVAAVGLLGDLPLVVLTANNDSAPRGLPGVSPEEAEELGPVISEAWLEMQLDLASQSTQGEQRTVPGANHFIHTSKPEAVTEAIRELLTDT